MLGRLSGRTHDVLTGVALHTRNAQRCDVDSTRVRFRELTAAEVAWYVGSGEPGGKAGAYAIQGRAARFVTRIEGSYTNVVGLPMPWLTTCCGSSSRTRRVLVAHEDQLTCGFGAELAARIADELFEYLDASIKRVEALDAAAANHKELVAEVSLTHQLFPLVEVFRRDRSGAVRLELQ